MKLFCNCGRESLKPHARLTCRVPVDHGWWVHSPASGKHADWEVQRLEIISGLKMAGVKPGYCPVGYSIFLQISFREVRHSVSSSKSPRFRVMRLS